jgi:hypothetical protein
MERPLLARRTRAAGATRSAADRTNPIGQRRELLRGNTRTTGRPGEQAPEDGLFNRVRRYVHHEHTGFDRCSASRMHAENRTAFECNRKDFTLNIVCAATREIAISEESASRPVSRVL